MHQVLVYGDSLSWGIVPGTRERLAFDQRWPGVLENDLLQSGLRVRVIEDCLNGRRTVWDDPFKPGRNGRNGLAQRMEIHSPLALVVLMLGTKDFQFSHPFNDAWAAAQGIAALVREIRTAPIEIGMPQPPILIVNPPEIREPKGEIAPKFRDAAARCAGLSQAYETVAQSLGCRHFDAGSVAVLSAVDGVHLDLPQHGVLGHALAPVVREILQAGKSQL